MKTVSICLEPCQACDGCIEAHDAARALNDTRVSLDELLADSNKEALAKAVPWRGSKTDFITDLLYELRRQASTRLKTP